MTGGHGAADRPVLAVLRALKLGDFLTAIPALRGLARAFPGHDMVLCAPARFSALLHHTGFDRLSPTPDLGPLAAGLGSPDIAVDLHGCGPESQSFLMASRPRRLVAFAHPALPETAGCPRWRPGEHEVRRWCRMLTESGVPADPADLRLRFDAAPAPDSPGPTIVHPGAASAARRWPAERFAEVARAEVARGRQVLLTGDPSEIHLTARVADLAGLPRSAVRAGRTSLPQLVDLVRSAGRVVSGDTGVAHLATATSTPSVVLFGPVPPSEWGPPPDPAHVTLWAGTRGDPHGTVTDPGLLEISVADVLRALAALPGWGAPE